jgi:phage terminase large subunit
MSTTSIAHEVTTRRRRAQPPPAERLTFADSLCEQIRAELALTTRIRFPSPRYREDPVAFFREILGVEPWSRQLDIIDAIRSHPRVAVCSGHKVSKSHTAAGIALWYYCSFPDARVVMTSTTSRQVDQILWRELRMMRARSGRCVDCKAADPDGHTIKRPCPHSTLIEGEQGELARTGLKSDDFREVVGFTAREAEAVAGISGRNLLYILDEASGIGDDIFQAIEGNRAGGARLAMFSNGTRNEGEFYEAFYSKSALYKTLRVSSEETPNAVEGREVIAGLATREWIEEKKIEWGENSPLYKVRVKGMHALAEEGKIFSIHAITEAERRWADTAEAGRLYVGVDPAGESGLGDEAAFAIRRGLKCIAIRCFLGLDEHAHFAHVLAFLRSYRLPRETPVVVVDREGSIGTKLFRLMRAYLDDERSPPTVPFDLVGVRASDKAIRQPMLYDRMRDELAANLEMWLRDGGAIPEDARLEKDLHALEYKQAANGRYKVTPKDQLRKILGRSPDRYDALSLSCWEPLSLATSSDVPPSVARAAAAEAEVYTTPNMDPYAGAATWGKR